MCWDPFNQPPLKRLKIHTYDTLTKTISYLVREVEQPPARYRSTIVIYTLVRWGHIFLTIIYLRLIGHTACFCQRFQISPLRMGTQHRVLTLQIELIQSSCLSAGYVPVRDLSSPLRLLLTFSWALKAGNYPLWYQGKLSLGNTNPWPSRDGFSKTTTQPSWVYIQTIQ